MYGLSTRAGMSGGIALAVALTLTGCSSAGSTACSDYNTQSITDQTSTLRNLLREHDLDPNDFGNIQGVTAAVTSLCGSNSSATLNEATDWDAETW
jgi:uncharacterized protein YraI